MRYIALFSALIITLTGTSYRDIPPSGEYSVNVKAGQAIGTVSPNVMDFNIVYCYEGDAVWGSGSGRHMFDIVQWALDMDKSGPVEVQAPGTSGDKNLTCLYANGLPVIHEDFGKPHGIQTSGDDPEVVIIL